MFLVGFMGSGKSMLGRELADRLGWEFVDLDSWIESREQKSIAEIFRERGEAGFREAETSTLRELTQSMSRDRVVALGGGAFVSQQNRELLRGWPSVFLHAPLEDLWQRCQADGIDRPLRKDREHFSRLHDERLPYYRQATVVVQTSGKDAAAICSEIESALHLDPASSGSATSLTGETP